MERYNAMDSPTYANSKAFARELVAVDIAAANHIMYDHVSIAWRDVIRTKISVSTASFTGECSANVPSQLWIHSIVPNSTLFVYTKAGQGNHFLAIKNLVKFIKDIEAFLEQTPSNRSAIEEESKVMEETLLNTTAAGTALRISPTRKENRT